MATQQNLGTAVFHIVASVDKFIRGVNITRIQLKRLDTSIHSIQATLKKVTVAFTVFSAAVIYAFKQIVQAGAEFEHSMQAVRAVVGGTEKELEALTKKALELGATTRFTAKEAAEGMFFLALAGLKTEEILAAIGPTLNLAIIGMMDLGKAADIATNVLIGFGLQATELTRVVDVLAAAETNTNTTVEAAAKALALVAPAAANAGQSIETVTAAVGLLANAGLKGTIAGTGLARIFSGLGTSMERIDKALSKYGSTFDKINPQFVKFTDIIREFKRIGLSTADAIDFFGERGGRSLLSLMNSSEEALTAIEEQLNNSFGVAVTQAVTRMQTLTGALIELKSRFEALKIAITGAISDSLRGIVLQFVDFTAQITAFLEANPEVVKALTLLIATLIGSGGLALAFATVSLVIGQMITGAMLAKTALLATLGVLKSLGSFLLTVSGAAAGVSAAFVPVGLALSAVIALIPPLIANFQNIGKVLNYLWISFIKPFFEGFVGAIVEIQTWVFRVSKVIAEALGTQLDRLFAVLPSLTTVFKVLGYVIGAFVIAPIVLLQAAFNAILTVGTILVKFLVDTIDFMIETGRELGILSDEWKTSTERLKENTEAMKKARKEAMALYDTIKDKMDETANASKDLNKMIGLLLKQDNLTPLELEELADLKAKFGDVGTSVKDTLKDLEGYQKTLKEILPLTEEGSDENIRMKATISQIDGAILDLTNSHKNFEKALEDQNSQTSKMNALSEEQLRNIAAERLARDELREAAGKAEEDIGDIQKERAKLAEQLTKKKVSSIQDEMDKIDELLAKYVEQADLEDENYSVRIRNAQEIVKEQSEIANETKRQLEKTDISDFQRKTFEETLASAEKSVDEQLELIEDLYEQKKILAEDEVHLTEHTESKKQEIIKESLDKQREKLFEDKIEAAKRSKDDQLVANLEAQKFINDRKKMRDELFQITEDMTEDQRKAVQENMKLFDQETQAKAEAMKKLEDKDKKKKVELSIEEQIAKKLGDQAQSLRDLVMLQTVLFRLRQREEEMLLSQAAKALRLRQLANSLAQSGAPQKKVQQADLRASLSEQLIQRRASSMGLDPSKLNIAEFARGIQTAKIHMEDFAQKIVDTNAKAVSLLNTLAGIGTIFAGGVAPVSPFQGLSGLSNVLTLAPKIPSALGMPLPENMSMPKPLAGAVEAASRNINFAFNITSAQNVMEVGQKISKMVLEALD